MKIGKDVAHAILETVTEFLKSFIIWSNSLVCIDRENEIGMFDSPFGFFFCFARTLLTLDRIFTGGESEELKSSDSESEICFRFGGITVY
jgi:hypothetical protein